MSSQVPSALTIAGTDPSGGAGIQADIKTLFANGVYGTSVITAVIAQNTQAVFDILNIPPDLIKKQLEAVFSDIPPLSVKIGMVGEMLQIRTIAETLRRYRAKNIVVDPVMGSSSGRRFMTEQTMQEIKKELFPLATLITPNIPEAAAFTGIKILSQKDMEKAAALLARKYGCAVLIKGGHRCSDADDLFYLKDHPFWLRSERIENPNTHGTGCTLSSAIAANLAKGRNLHQSVSLAKAYIYDAIFARLDLGQKNGPIDHAVSLTGKYRE